MRPNVPSAPRRCRQVTAPGCPWVSFLLSLSVVSQDTISVGIQRNVLKGSQILAPPQTITFAVSTRH